MKTNKYGKVVGRTPITDEAIENKYFKINS